MQFYRHFLRAVVISSVLISGALAVGTGGYHWLVGCAWIDALLNATMISTGRGPVGGFSTSTAVPLATAYVLFSASFFFIASGIILSLMVHRGMRKFQADDSDPA